MRLLARLLGTLIVASLGATHLTYASPAQAAVASGEAQARGDSVGSTVEERKGPGKKNGARKNSKKHDSKKQNKKKRGKKGGKKPQADEVLIPPTSRTYLKATCVVADEDGYYGQAIYDVTLHWQVTGGRYANMGKGPNYTYGDYVYNGEARVVTTQMRFYGWPGWGEPMQQTSVTVSIPFQQMIAPIGQEEDRSTWVNLYEREDRYITCA